MASIHEYALYLYHRVDTCDQLFPPSPLSSLLSQDTLQSSPRIHHSTAEVYQPTTQGLRVRTLSSCSLLNLLVIMLALVELLLFMLVLVLMFVFMIVLVLGPLLLVLVSKFTVTMVARTRCPKLSEVQVVVSSPAQIPRQEVAPHPPT